MSEAVQLAGRVRRSVLIVTSAAALCDGTHAARARKVVCELSHHGWFPILLLAGTSVECRRVMETPLPPDTRVICVLWRAARVSRRLPNTLNARALAWCVRAAGRGREVVRKHAPSIVLTIGTSAMFHTVGKWISRTTDTMWIADLPEAPDEMRPNRRRLYSLSHDSADHVVQHAKYWLAASSELQLAWATLRKAPVPESRIVRTGFDSASVSEPVRLISNWVHKETFRIVCLCTPRSHHAVQRLLQAIAALVRQQVLSASSIHVDIAFSSNPEQAQTYLALIDQLQLTPVASLAPFGSDNELRQLIQVSSAVVLAGEAGPTSGELMSYLCESMPARKPVLALSGDRETADTLTRSQVGTIVPKGNIPATIAAVSELVRTGNAAPWFDPKWSVIREFSASHQVKLLSDFLIELTVRKQTTHSVDSSWRTPPLRQD